MIFFNKIIFKYKFGLEGVLLSAIVNKTNDVIQKWGHIVSAQPVAARTSSATKNVWTDQEEVETKVSPQRQGSSTPAGTDICSRAQEFTPKTEQPSEKRAKRGAGEEEREEGELVDSSGEEDGHLNETVLCSENYDDAESSFNDGKHVDVSGCRHSSRDGSLGEVFAGAAEPSTSSEATEVTMTEEDSVKEPETVRSVHCQHGNESADAADSCQME